MALRILAGAWKRTSRAKRPVGVDYVPAPTWDLLARGRIVQIYGHYAKKTELVSVGHS